MTPQNGLLALVIFALAASVCHPELAEWKAPDGSVELKADGRCVIDGRSFRPKAVPTSGGTCGDPLYGALNFCARQAFYGPDSGGIVPKEKYKYDMLYLLNGCLRCPHGKAEATVRLINRQPGSLFSSCSDEEIIVGTLLAKLGPRSRRSSHGEGTFAVGGILQTRDCGLIGSSRETSFEELLLEVTHNCGREQPMMLVVPLPAMDVEMVRESWGQPAMEWDGLTLDLSLSAGGWDHRVVPFVEEVMPRGPPKKQQAPPPAVVKQPVAKTVEVADKDKEEDSRQQAPPHRPPPPVKSAQSSDIFTAKWGPETADEKAATTGNNGHGRHSSTMIEAKANEVETAEEYIAVDDDDDDDDNDAEMEQPQMPSWQLALLFGAILLCAMFTLICCRSTVLACCAHRHRCACWNGDGGADNIMMDKKDTNKGLMAPEGKGGGGKQQQGCFCCF